MSETGSQGLESPTTGDEVLDEGELSELLEREEFYVAICREFGGTVGREFGAVVGGHLEDELRRRLEESERAQRVVSEDESSTDSEGDAPEGRIERFKAWLVTELRAALRRVIATVPEVIETLTDDGQGSDPEQGDSESEVGSSDVDVDTVPESVEDLESLSYRELQKVAKEAGIKANISREQMTDRLSDELNLDASA